MTLSGKNSRGAGDKSVRSLEVVNDFTPIARFENMNHVNVPDNLDIRRRRRLDRETKIRTSEKCHILEDDVEEMETDGGML